MRPAVEKQSRERRPAAERRRRTSRRPMATVSRTRGQRAVHRGVAESRVVDVCDTGAVEADDDVDHDGPEQTNQAGCRETSGRSSYGRSMSASRQWRSVEAQLPRRDHWPIRRPLRWWDQWWSYEFRAHNFRFNRSNRLEVAAHNGPRLLAEGESSEITARFMTSGRAHVHKHLPNFSWTSPNARWPGCL